MFLPLTQVVRAKTRKMESFTHVKDYLREISWILENRDTNGCFLEKVQGKLKAVNETMLHIHTTVQLMKNKQEEAPNPLLETCITFTQLVKVVFEHCKDSSQTYDSILLKVSAELSAMFKTSYTILKSIFELLEGKAASIIESDGEDVRNSLSKVLESMIQSAHILKDIDATPMGNTWRAISRLTSTFKEMAIGALDLAVLFESLCSCISSKLDYWLSLVEDQSKQQEGDTSMGNKIMKLLRFLVSLLLQYVQETKDNLFGQATISVLHLVAKISSCLPSSVTKSLNGLSCYSDLQSTVLSVIEPLLIELVDARDFRRGFSAALVGNKIEESLPWLRLSIMLLTTISRAPVECCEFWMQGTDPTRKEEELDSVLHDTFKLVRQSSKDLFTNVKLPMMVSKGQPIKDISMYEFAYVHICAFVSSLPANLFHVVENCLLVNLFSSDFTSMLSADIWCFISRWGSADLCWDHVKFLADLMLLLVEETKSSPQRQLFVVGRLLKRMFPFLLDKHQEEFLRLYPIRKPQCKVLWYFLPTQRLSVQIFEKIIGGVLGTPIQRLDNAVWLTDILLLRAITDNETTLRQLPAILTSELQEKAITSWKTLVHDPKSMNELTAANIVGFLTNLVPHIDEHILCQEILIDAETLMKKTKSEITSLSFCKLIFQLSKLLGPNPQMRDSLVSSYVHLSSHENMMVSSKAVFHLRRISESPLGLAVQEALSSKGPNSDVFTNFNQLETYLEDDVIHDLLVESWDSLQRLKECRKAEVVNPYNSSLSPSYDKEQKPTSESEPIPKRAKLEESSIPAELNVIMDSLEDQVKGFKATSKGSVLSDELRHRLQNLRQEIDHLLADDGAETLLL